MAVDGHLIKLLYDKRELDTAAGRLTVGVLVLQDLFAIFFLALQPDLRSPALGVLAVSLGKVGIIIAVAFPVSRFVLPPLFNAVARLPELVQVGALAWCFLVAGLASILGLSREMGALIAGVALSTFPYTLDVVAKVTSLRDFFVTLFFVALGMEIPAPSWYFAGWSLAIGLFLVMSRLTTVFPPLHWMRQGHRVSTLPNTVLKGTDNLRLLQQLRELNRSARIIVHAELLEEVPRLYAAGADYVTVPRLLEAVELLAVMQAADRHMLAEKRAALDRELADRHEVIP